MISESKKRAAQSAHDRLLALNQKGDDAFELVMARYALERLLFRLSKSEYKSELVLKGAMLFQAWLATPHRATRDLDLLARGTVAPEWVHERLHVICSVAVEEDGLLYDLSKLKVSRIREEARYGGVRAVFTARLGTAAIPLQIDFGVGDVITPAPVETKYPTLLGMEAPLILAYPRETVVAEKLEAIVDRGMENSRMKDYFDLWFIATTFDHDISTLRLAVRRTFERRGQALPAELPIGLTEKFATDAKKLRQWEAFQKRNMKIDLALSQVVEAVSRFAAPIFYDPE